MIDDTIANLVRIGFSEYEAKAYLALLKKSPVSGYELAKTSSVPRSMIYEVLSKLVTRGAAMTLPSGSGNKYAPVAAEEYLDQFYRQQEALVSSLREELTSMSATPDLDYVWNIEGHENIIAKAIEMIRQAETQLYLALVPATFPALRSALATAVARGVRVVLYTTGQLDLPGAQIVVAQVAERTLGQARGLGLILVIDGQQVLVGEWLTATQARASWTSTPLLVFIAEHHLRTDLYLPQILAQLGDRALEIIQEQDRELFARALESRTNR